MKPYKWGGRFYNSQRDSIYARFKNFIKSFIYVARNQVKIQNINRKKFKKSFIQNQWVITADPAVTSQIPVITWIGHSTFLIQVGGINIITDPIFGSGFPFFKRLVPMPIPLEKLPKIDVILISHNHKDHMHKQSLLALKKHDPLVLVPEGDGRWFSWHGFARAFEKTWWQDEIVGVGQPLTITFLPAVHWTSRGLIDVNRSLWGSWFIDAGEGRRIYFAGDTAYGDHFAMIAQRMASIDVALMPIGPNEPRCWVAEAHLSTQEAINAFVDLKAKHFIPMHWGTFAKLTGDVFDEPLKQLIQLWQQHAALLQLAQLHVVKFGEPRRF